MLAIIVGFFLIFFAFWLDAHRDAWPSSSNYHTYKIFSLVFFACGGFYLLNLWLVLSAMLAGSILWDFVYRWRRYGNWLHDSAFFLTIPGKEIRLIDKLGGPELLLWAFVRLALTVIFFASGIKL